ncbi:MAG TPA: metallophosphoesterase [Clostridiales bacterium]|nr:metallophosphoesterase [Clostridiales bacterium]
MNYSPKNKSVLKILGFSVLCGVLYYQNTALQEGVHIIKSEKLPLSFKGFKIAHISDFHNCSSRLLQKQIVESLEENKPDIIVITGDSIDKRRTNIYESLAFFAHIRHIAPMYLVTGNHEHKTTVKEKFLTAARKIGVNVLENEFAHIEHDDGKVTIFGLDDPFRFENDESEKERVDEIFSENQIENGFNILLAHRPELYEVYEKHGFDLVFSGHAHGGQMRIPFVGGVIAPHQGFFPKYSEGLHEFESMKMIVSRGLGNSIIPFRINNRPEIVYVISD